MNRLGKCLFNYIFLFIEKLLYYWYIHLIGERTLVMVRINNDLHLPNRMYIPKSVKIVEDSQKVSLLFDEIVSSDIDTLLKILTVVREEYSNTEDRISILFNKDIVLLISDNGWSKTNDYVFDRDNGKIIFSYDDYFNGTGIDHFIPLLRNTKYYVSVLNGEVYMEPEMESYFDYKNYDTVVYRFLNYYKREISKYCNDESTSFELKIRPTSQYGTISSGSITKLYERESFSTSETYNYIHPRYVCEFLGKVNIDNVKTINIVPGILNSHIIGENIYSPIGKFKVKTYIKNKKKEIVSDKEYDYNKIQNCKKGVKIVDVDKYYNVSIYDYYNSYTIFSIDNKPKYFILTNFNDLIRYKLWKPFYDINIYSLFENIDLKSLINLIKIINNFVL